MKMKLYVCLAVGTLMCAAHAVATPFSTAFLSVDLNGANYGGGQTVGPTQAGYQAWSTFQGYDQLDPAYNAAALLPQANCSSTDRVPSGAVSA